jgi:hypothetical protein
VQRQPDHSHAVTDADTDADARDHDATLELQQRRGHCDRTDSEWCEHLA